MSAHWGLALIAALTAAPATAGVPGVPLSDDRLLFYTDAIRDAANAHGDLYGEARFQSFIQGHGNLAADAFARTLLGDLASWSGIDGTRGQEDDLTLLIVDVA